MTDRPPPDPDEIASAVTDGEASFDDVNATDGDVGLVARVDEFRRIQDAHRSLGLLEAAESTGADERIATAMAEMHDGHVPLRSAGPPGPPRMLIAAGIAAAVLLVVAGVTVMRPDRDDTTAAGDNSAASSLTTPRQEAAGGATAGDENRALDRSSDKALVPGDGTAQGTAAAGEQSPTTAQSTVTPHDASGLDHLPSLGTFTDVDHLLDAVRNMIGDMVPLDGASALCPGALVGSRGTLAGSAIVGATPVVVIVAPGTATPGTATPGTVMVVEPSTCRVLTP